MSVSILGKKIRVGKIARLLKRKRRIRKTVIGVEKRPRLSVSRSVKHMYAQIVNDEKGATIAFVSTTGKGAEGKTKSERAKWAGKKLAELALAKGVTEVVFDRGGRRFHGRIKAVADGAREGGLKF